MSCCGKPKQAIYEDEPIIGDHFKTFTQIKEYLYQTGVKQYDVVFYLDFSRSNLLNQETTLLHTDSQTNPYYMALEAVALAAAQLDSDQKFLAYRYGCTESKHLRIVPLYQDQVQYEGIDALLCAYKQACRDVTFSGPVQLSKCFENSIEFSKQNPGKHIVSVLITNSQSQSEIKDINALKQASMYPISFCCFGVGRKNLQTLELYDDLKGRNVDNFQFVDFDKIKKKVVRLSVSEAKLIDFIGCQIFMEIPFQAKQMHSKDYYNLDRTVIFTEYSAIVTSNHETQEIPLKFEHLDMLE
ncbi:Copine I [Spironucleus salmonicida]|uniref:Copine I n=1 Tax=Spironucleus salmonicida TaxID=348837 RepID=V6LS04_9EUKA|nr:Copine I [Spironucleus salmonicida]|eukprot:EST46471.1 Copine I [Spironucleus salmonicida]